MKEADIRAGIEAMWAAYNEQDVDGFVAGAAEDLHVSFDGAPTYTNRNDFRSYAKGFFDWTSNGKVTVQNILVNGKQATAELRLVGTHDREPLYGVEAAGKTVDLTWIIAGDFENGKLQNLRVYFNPMVMLEQVGAIEDAHARPGTS